ncbi:MAG TPA: bifunctional diaminohydroxyphosphoribosylaminopyrimidine deaminase/5-amino-6-(5-phosphoribosylamino)uracil reductase RibD [Chloroflexota bacterium]|jgi:diaminohydroxyphosphoribosylaminopyrimidine deaminase/5-amino-6-(5-phosphoribosylamino)uracil reductase
MARALELAERALGLCSPNPAVGAVLVKDGRIVGEGWTQAPGQAHAEIVALEQASEAAAGATLYVTLEPCCHWGRTPPCTDALLRARVREVHMAIIDPNPQVAGKGRRQLEDAGIPTVLGEYEPEARRLNDGYFKYIATGLPFVAVKWAMTLDGKIATRTGSSFWVTGEAARARVARLRAVTDAVMVGVGTVLADDPQLTVRRESFPEPLRAELDQVARRQPLRVILDSQARTPPSARVAGGDLPGHTLILVTERAPADRRAALQATAADVVTVPELDGRVHPRLAMDLLAEREITSVLVEAGGTLVASLLEARLVDKVYAFVAPKLVGGDMAPTPVEGSGCPEMAQAVALRDLAIERLGDDLLIAGYLPTAADTQPDGLAVATGAAH